MYFGDKFLNWPLTIMNPEPNSTYSYQVGGSLPVDAPTYVKRQADDKLFHGLMVGEFCYVLNSRQMGKSSLRVQTMRRLQASGVVCAAIDLTAIGSQDITSEQWYAGIIYSLASSFDLLDRFDILSWWGDRSFLSALQRLNHFIEQVLLKEITENIVIFIDEIDSILSLSFNVDDFFSLIRSCYNKRADNLEYKRLSFALLGVATPSDLIKNRNISTPFNIGKPIELEGFKLNEAIPLVAGFSDIFNNSMAVLREILNWTGGQPFLTQKVCQIILSYCREVKFNIYRENEAKLVAEIVRSQIIENWEAKDEPEHLRTIRDRLLYSHQSSEELLLLYRQILQVGEIPTNNQEFHRELRLTGLVVKEKGKLRVYNQIYAAVFNLNWVENLLQEAGLLSEEAEETSIYSESDIKQIEKIANDALLEFEYSQIEGLVLAILAGKKLKKMLGDDLSLQEYPTITPIYTLQKTLAHIRQRNQFISNQIGVKDISFSPNGEYLAIAEINGTILLQHLLNPHSIQLKGHENEVLCVKFSPNGKQLATAGEDGIIQLWNLQGQQINQFKSNQGAVNEIRFSPDGKNVATVAERGVQLWNISGRSRSRCGALSLQQRNIHSSWKTTVSFTPDGECLAVSVRENTVRLWKGLKRQPTELKANHIEEFELTDVKMSWGGEYLFCIGKNGIVRLWNFPQRRLLDWETEQDEITNVCFSPSDRYIATAELDGTTKIWELSGKLLTEFHADRNSVTALSFTPDEKQIATVGADGTIRIWDIFLQQSMLWKTQQSKVSSVSFSLAGKIATGGEDGSIKIWNMSGQLLTKWKSGRGKLTSINFSNDGKYLATAGRNRIQIWQQDGQLVSQCQPSQDLILEVKFSPNGKSLVAVGANGTAILRNLEGKQLAVLKRSKRRIIASVSFSSDGDRIVTGGWDGKVCIWNLSGQLLANWDAHRDKVKSVSFSADGEQVASAGREKVKVWDVSGQLLTEWSAHQGKLLDVCFSLDWQRVATVGNNYTVILWDFSGRKLAEWHTPKTELTSIGFSQDGKYLVAGGENSMVYLWRVESLDELLVRGCEWLQDYFLTHPEELEKLEVSQHQNSVVENVDFSNFISQEIVNQATDIPVSLSLNSNYEINYIRLRDLLAVGEWRAADLETTAIMLKIAGRESKGWLRAQDIINFPCHDLLTIDNLWVRYSNGKFGFSIQKEIWQSCGATKDRSYQINNLETYNNFSEKLGWKIGSKFLTYEELSFNFKGQNGHLPGGILNWLWFNFYLRQSNIFSEETIWWEIIPAIAMKLDVCQSDKLVKIYQGDGEGFLGEFLVHDKVVKIYQGDITNLKVDVIVSSIGGLVCDRIRQVGGEDIGKEMMKLRIEMMKPTFLHSSSFRDVVMTSAGKLQAKKVFYGLLRTPYKEVIQYLVNSCIKIAHNLSFKTIAFPLFGSGAGVLSAQEAWQIMLPQIVKSLSDENQTVREVIICIYGRKAVEEINVRGTLQQIQSLGWESL